MKKQNLKGIMKMLKSHEMESAPRLYPNEKVLRELRKRKRAPAYMWKVIAGTAAVAVFAVFLLVIIPRNGQEDRPTFRGPEIREPSKEAQKLFRQALEINKGNAVISEESLKRKAALYKAAVEDSPQYAEAWNNYADVLESLGDYPGAIAAYEKAIEEARSWGLPYFGLGDVYLKQGLYKKAQRAYEEGLARETGLEEDRRLTLQHLEYVKTLLGGMEKDGVIVASAIVSILDPPVFRGADGIVDAPTITFHDSQIGFATDSAEILSQAREQLNELGIAIRSRELAGKSFLIAGHADERASKRFRDNLALSEARANAVRDYLIRNHGILPESLYVKGYGSTRPIAFGHNEAAWAANRRVEIRKLEAEDINLMQSEGAKPVSQNRISSMVYGLLFQKEAQHWRVVRDDDTVYSGESYRIYLRPNSDLYVYVYQEDSTGKGYWLFPNADIALNNPLKGGVDYWIPRRDRTFRLDDTSGTERIYIVAATDRATDLEQLIDNPSSGREEVIRITTRGVANISSTHNAEIDMELENMSGEAEFYRLIRLNHR